MLFLRTSSAYSYVSFRAFIVVGESLHSAVPSSGTFLGALPVSNSFP